MIRQNLTKKKAARRHIKWRGHDILRIESFSDAIFAFAMTLLVVSLEVPKTFAELKMGMSGVPGFAICFSLLFFIWHDQYIFFRHYYLNDTRTIFLNAILLFTVLFYVYPLKFLFSLLIDGNTFMENGVAHEKLTSYTQLRDLMEIYGLGFFFIYFVFLLLYMNAMRHKEKLQLNNIEIYHTKTEMYKQGFMMFFGLSSAIAAYLVPDIYTGTTGFFYMLIGPVLVFLFKFRFARMKKIFSQSEMEEHDVWVAG